VDGVVPLVNGAPLFMMGTLDQVQATVATCCIGSYLRCTYGFKTVPIYLFEQQSCSRSFGAVLNIFPLDTPLALDIWWCAWWANPPGLLAGWQLRGADGRGPAV